MPIRIVNPWNGTCRTGVPQFNARLQTAFAKHGISVPWESTEGWGNGTIKGDPAHDICIVTNEDAVYIPPEIAVIAMQHGCAIERFNRAGEAWFGAIDPQQRRAAQRPRTYWVSCSDECAYEYFTHHGYHADKIILNGLDTDTFFPSERQTRKDTAKPLVLHHAVDDCKGKDAIGPVAAELGADFEVRKLDVPATEVPNAMRDADMFLCLSRLEGCPYVVNEALASGLVVVTTDTGLYWRADAPPGLRIRWQDRDDPKLVAAAIRSAWSAPHSLSGRQWALRWLNLGAFGQAWIEAVMEACKKFGVTP